MNRLKICNKFLLQDGNRGIYSISSDFHSHDSANVEIVRFYEKPCRFAKTSPRTYREKSTSPILLKKFVSSSSSKINGFCAFASRRECGIFGQQRLTVAATANNLQSCRSIRRFSDATSVGIPTYLQLEGFWKDLSECAAVEFCQNGFVTLHNATGLPWWATIVLATWTVRATVTLPLAIYQSKILAKVENLKFEMDDIVKELKMETNFAVHKFKWTEDYARKMYNRSLKKQWKKLIERENCHPMKSAVILVVQIPMWIVLSTSLRNLCYMLPYPSGRAYAIYLELTTGGFGWVQNLAAVDHSFAIPITLGLLNLTIIEIQNLMRTTEPSRTQKYLTNFFRLVALGMIPLASYVPAAMSLYWASSSAFGIVQNLLIMSPSFRRLVRIPPTDYELEEPYKHLCTSFRRRIGLKDVSLPNTVKKL